MRRLWIALLLAPLWASAQTVDSTAEQYAVRYVREHALLRSGDDFNVVDLNMEWPEAVGHREPVVLQRHLVRELFGLETASLDSARTAYMARLGVPVSGQLERLPDDDRFCYLAARLQVVAYAPGRWLVMRVECDDQPGRLSPVKARRGALYVVYDVARQQVLSPDRMVRQELLQEGAVEPSFFELLYAPLSDADYEGLRSANITGAWPEADGKVLAMHVVCTTAERTLSYDVRMPYDDVRYVVRKEGRRLFEKVAAPPAPAFVMAPPTWQGDTIYKKVDVMPEFRGGKEGLRAYLGGVVAPANTRAGRVMLSYVVDKEGWVRDVRVVSPLTPELDRHAAALVKGMPRYTPGTLRGEPVCVRLYLPVHYR